MMTVTPARIMNLSDKGRIAPGMDADFVVFDDNIEVKKVFSLGNLI